MILQEKENLQEILPLHEIIMVFIWGIKLWQICLLLFLCGENTVLAEDGW